MVVVVVSNLLAYNEDRLIEELSKLAPAARALFAAACAERMLPIYRWFHQRTGRGDPDALASALTELWDDLEGNPSLNLQSHQQVAEDLVPYEDDSWVDECAFAQHTAAAIAYAIRSRLTGEAQEAAWAARQIYEALDFRVTTRDDVDLNVAGVEEQVAADPLIQAELNRQRRDLRTLRGVSSDEVVALGSRIRQTARSEATDVFDLQVE